MKIAIIGAGLAGLTAAIRIPGAQVFEARDRVGGRVLSAQVNGHTVELGGQNVADGGEARHLRALIKECGLNTIKNRFGLNFFCFQGDAIVPEKEAIASSGVDPEELSDIARDCTSMAEVLERLFGRDQPLYKSLGVRLSAYEGGSVEKMCSSNIDTLYYMLKGGLSPVHQNDVELESVEGGNSSLAKALAERIGDRLHLGMPLRKIEKGQRYTLTFDGSVETFDVVVLAIPTSVYPSIEFGEGVIPADRFKKMSHIEYGQNAKILVPAPKGRPRTSFINDRMIAWNDLSCGMITMYYTGEASRYNKETLKSVYDADRNVIERGFEWEAPDQVTFAKDALDQSYSGPVGYSWPNDPYVRGSYTYVSVGNEQSMTELTTVGGVRCKKLFTPIDNLYFAGEHTSTELDAIGTMEAAVESGENAAKLVNSSGLMAR